MGRVSRARAEENRQRVVEVAARLFRQRGVAGTGVADVMNEAGLTHGGFYRQFASKESLLAEAAGAAIEGQGERLAAMARESAGRDEARRRLIETFLSPAHRDEAAEGCPLTALATDVGREDPASPVRDRYADGVEAFAHWLGDDLVTLSTLIGALTLARATSGTELSDRILVQAAAALKE
ncbi:TetR family transcriptional regulator [Actinoplanes sp. NPDC049265]|uniref:TetR family transcriptional regulator n=1 Tax=Actinoplanes sp. NPDC049265 TaxID=3363902 RepID=UPI0037196563